MLQTRLVLTQTPRAINTFAISWQSVPGQGCVLLSVYPHILHTHSHVLWTQACGGSQRLHILQGCQVKKGMNVLAMQISMHVTNSLILVGNLPGYQRWGKYISWGDTTDTAVCLVALFSCIELIQLGKSDPAADTSITLAALTAGKYSRPAGTPGSPESYVGSEWGTCQQRL